MADQTTTERFIADTSAYVRRVEEAAREADSFGRSSSEAALAARQMGATARDAADRAGRAMRAAANDAERLARGEISAATAADSLARGARELERSDIAAARAARSAARATDELAAERRQAARAAVEAAAMERLAALRAQGDIRNHNLLLDHLRRNYNGAGRDVSEMSTLAGRAFSMMQRSGTSAFAQISKGADSFAQSGPAGIAMVVAALALVPVAAIAASGAITLGLGGALAAVGIMAAAKSAEVKRAWSGVADSAKAQAAKWSAPWKPALMEIAGDAERTVKQLDLTPVFAEMAPAVRSFAHDASQGLLELRPAITAVGHNFDILLAKLGPEMPQIMGNFGSAIEQLANTAGEHADEFASMAVGISQMVSWTAKFIDVAADIAPVVNPVIGVMDLFGRSGGHLQETLTSVESSSIATGAALGAMGGEATTAAAAARMLGDKLNELLNPSLSVFNDTTRIKDGMVALRAALKASRGEMDLGTAASRAARTAFAGEIATVADLGEHTLKLTGSREKERLAVAKQLPELYALAGSNKSAKAQVDALAKSFDINAHDAKTAKAEIKKLKEEISGLRSKRIAIDIITHTNIPSALLGIALGQAHAAGGYIGEGYRAGGAVRGYAKAGPVFGPGTSTSDEIPARLSNGEYVVKAAATAMNRQALDAANYFGASLIAVGKSSPWGKGSQSSNPWGKDTVFGKNPDPRPRTIAKPPPRMPPHYGLQSYGSSYGQQQQVVQHVYIAGSVTTENALLSTLQTLALQQNKPFVLPAGR